MHWAHLFEIDETSLVNIPYNRNNYDPWASAGETFKWLVAWKQSPPKPKFFFENLSPSSNRSYNISKKPKRVKMRRKSHWGSWSFRGFPLIALSLGFTLIRVVSRFLIERIFFRILSDRVFFDPSEIGSSSLGHVVINSSLHQCSFPQCRYFVSIVLLLFLTKTDVSFCVHYNSQK